MTSGGARYRLLLSSFAPPPSNTWPIGAVGGRVGDDEEIVRAAQVRRHLHRGGDRVAGAGAQAVLVRDHSQVAVGLEVEVGVGREVDQVVPVGHRSAACRRRALVTV